MLRGAATGSAAPAAPVANHTALRGLIGGPSFDHIVTVILVFENNGVTKASADPMFAKWVGGTGRCLFPIPEST